MAQTESEKTDTLRKNDLKVFMEEYDSIKKEVAFINHFQGKEVAYFTTSAGNFYMYKIIELETGFEVVCYGKSESLDLVSNPE